MSICDLSGLQKRLIELVAKGLSIANAMKMVKTEATIRSDAEKLRELGLITKTESSPLTEDERKELVTLFFDLSEIINEDFLTSDQVKGSIGKVIRNALGDEKADRFLTLLSKRGFDFGKEFGSSSSLINRRRHIEYLQNLVKLHREAGDDDIAADLQEKILIEEDRLARREENLSSLINQSDGLLEKEYILDNLIFITQLVEAESKTTLETDGRKRIKKLEDKLEAKKAEIKEVENLIAIAKSKLITTKNKKRKDEIKEEIKALNDKRKSLLKEASDTNAQFKKEVVRLTSAKIKDITGTDVASRAKTLDGIRFILSKELEKVQSRMMELGLSSLVSDVRDVSLTSEQILINQRKLTTIATEGMDIRLQYLQKDIDSYGYVSVTVAEEMFGEFAIKTVINKREKLASGSLDYGPLSAEEIKEAAQIWKNQLISTYDGSFLSEDPALMTEEALNTLRSFAVGRGTVDGNSPEAMDPTFAPALTPEQAALHPDNNRGIIPAQNTVKSHREAARIIEGTIRRLRTVFGFKYFNGTINEKILRQILDSKLMDIHPDAFKDALTEHSQRRVLNTIDLDSKLNLAKALLIQHGANLDEMPEFSPGWNTNNSKLISIDIESFGNINDPEKKVDGVYCIQISTYDSSSGTTVKTNEILVNDGSTEDAVNAKTKDVKTREVLTKNQITKILQRVEELQNQGFKVITHNGNGFDLPQLRYFVDDSDLLARVSLRSIDLLANITTQASSGTILDRRSVRGKKLKELAKNNLPARVETTAYPDASGKPRVQFTSGYPVNLETGNEIRLTDEGITPLWQRGKETGDFFEFDAYSENDADLTIALYLHMSDPGVSDLLLKGEKESKGTIISVTPPKSNLFLNNDSDFTGLMPIDTLSDIQKISPKINESIEQVYFYTNTGYDANKVYDILLSMWVGSLMGDPTTNEAKLNSLLQGLKGRVQLETELDRNLYTIAVDNQRAVRPILLEKFNEFGYVLNLNYQIDDRNDAVVVINDNLDGSLPVAQFNEARLFSNNVTDPRRYELAVLDSFIKFINKPEIKNRFKRALEQRVKPRAKKENETETEYWESVIIEYFSQFINPESVLDSSAPFTEIRQFGNGEIDWKPADEVGIAFAQVMMDQKPDLSVVDTLIQNGESAQSIAVIDEQTIIAKGGRGRKKIYGMPSRDKVNMAQPHALSSEELAYDGWRLLQRINHILDLKFTDKIRENVDKWLVSPQGQDWYDPISFFAKQQVLAISPDINVRHPFSVIPTLEKKRQLVSEHLFEIPRLLMSFNHDCAYMGINAPPRFFKDSNAVFYMQDFMSPGGPSAASLMGGAIDQLAHMLSYGMMTPEAEAELGRIIDRGMEIIATQGDEAWNRTNKSDYKYNGKHNILAMIVAFNDSKLDVFDDMLRIIGAVDEAGLPATMGSKKLIVSGKELGDPRFIFLDLLIGKTSNDGILKQMSENPSRFNITEEDAKLARGIISKFGDTTDAENRNRLKEFLKGAITPAFYQAGYPGIYQGLTNKAKEAEVDLTDEEIQFLARVSVRSQLISSGQMIDKAIQAQVSITPEPGNTEPKNTDRLIDKAIGFNNDTIKNLRKFLLTKVQRLNSSTYSSTLTGSKALMEARNRKQRLATMQEWAQVSAKETAKAVARIRGEMSPSPKKLEKLTESLQKEIMDSWGTRLEQAAAYWEDKSIDGMSAEEYNTFIYHMNSILSGGEEAAKNHLMLFALNRRAATPFMMQDDVVDIHRFTMGVHIDSEDYMRYLNREIYFRYGVETASGRNHMVSWYGLGPESSKYAQPRVLTPGGDYNPYGMWDIREVPPVENFEDLFRRQTLLDLAKFYAPSGTDYDFVTSENRLQYFRDLEARSAREIEATELAKYLEKAPSSREYEFAGGIRLSVKDRNARNRKAAGTAYDRLRFRTLAPEVVDPTSTVVLDLAVDGFGALRPAYADIDFTQRGIYALAAAQHLARVRDNRATRLIKEAQERMSKDPNGFVSPELRGYKSMFEKPGMPTIPMDSSDLIGATALGHREKVEQNAIRLQNVLINFAKTNGLDELLERKDWGRIFAIMEVRNKAIAPTAKVIRSSKESRTGIDEILEKEEKIREANITFVDGLLKVMGVSSITLSGLKRFSPLDLMATLEERQVTLEDIQEIKSQFGAEPGWFQVLSYFGLKGKIDRLMTMEFGLTLDPGTIVRGREGRTNIPSTSQIPIVAFGREVLQLYQVIGSSDTLKRVATNMIAGSKYESDPNVKFDQNNFVIIESLDPKTDAALYKKIWETTIAKKKEIAEEMLKQYYFVINSENRLTLRDRNGNTFKEDQSEVALSVQGPTDPYAQISSQVDNPSTLWLNTPQGLIQMLNNLENYKLFSEIELAIQTNKEIYGFKTDLDKVIQEQEAQMFERLRGVEEDISDSIVFLYTLDPGKAKPIVLSDYRHQNLSGLPKKILDLGAYIRTGDQSTVTFKVRTSDIDPVTKKYSIKSVSMSAVDAAFFTKFTEIIVKAEQLGFEKEAAEIGDFLVWAISDSLKTPKGVTTSNYIIKVASMLQDVLGNEAAERNVFNYFKAEKMPITSRSRVMDIAETINKIMDHSSHELTREYYITLASMERMVAIPQNLREDSVFIKSMAAVSRRELTPQVINNIRQAVKDFGNVAEEPEIADEIYANTESPAIYTDTSDFIMSFTDAEEREYATRFVDYLEGLVANGIISQRAMDLKLMLVGNITKHNPGFMKDLNFVSTDEEGIMYAEKKGTRYIIGQNFSAMKVTPENEILMRFAEELVHIARMKYIKTNSAEWARVTGLFSTNRAPEAIREMLMAMNSGKTYDQLEAEVEYAMNNPDEFFAHMGAFFLLRETLGSKEALNALRIKFSSISKSITLWQKAFYRIKGMAKRVLITFNKLQNDPYYGSFMKEAEDVVMSVIGKGLATREEVDNPNLRLNAFKRVSTTESNRDLNLVERAELTRLNNNLRIAENDLKVELRKPTRDPIAIANLERTINSLKDEIKAKDVETFMGIGLGRTISDIQNLNDFANIQGRRLTERDLIDNGFRRSFLVHLIRAGVDRRGERVDSFNTFAGVIRKLPFLGSDTLISTFLQNNLLASFNGSGLTYNSPFAPLVVLSDLIDETSVVTSGSLRSNVGGIQNDKALIEPYIYNVMVKVSEMGSAYPNDTAKHIQITQDVIRYMNGITPITTDAVELAHVESIAKSFRLLRDKTTELQEFVGLKEKSKNADVFPVRLRDTSLLEDRGLITQGYDAVKDVIKKKNLDLVTRLGVSAPMPPLMLWASGIIPFEDDTMPDADNKMIDEIVVNLRNGVDTSATSGRMAVLDWAIRVAAKNAVTKGGRLSTTADYANTRGNVGIYKDAMDVIKQLLWQTRDSNVTFGSTFTGMTSNNMNVLLQAYTNALTINYDSTTTNNWNTKFQNPNIRKHFAIPDKQIQLELRPNFTDRLEPSDILAIEFLNKTTGSATLIPSESVFLNSSDIFLSGNATMIKLFETNPITLAKGLGKVSYDAIERKAIQELTGVTGAFFNISQILNMFEAEVIETTHSNTKSFNLLNSDGLRQEKINHQEIMLQGIKRLHQALKESKGQLSKSDLDLGQSLADWNKRAKTFVLMRFGMNINTATYMVEGVMSTMAQLTQTSNPFESIMYLLAFSRDLAEESIVNKARSFVDTLPVPRKVQDSTGRTRRVVNPVRQRRIRRLAQNTLMFIEESTSPMLPSNLLSLDPTSDLVEKLGWWDRYKLNRARANSTAMKSVRVAMDASGNRHIMNLSRKGHLKKLRQAYLNAPSKPQSIDQIKQLLWSNNLGFIDQEVAVYIIQSGLLEAGVLEALDSVRRESGLFRGVLLFQSTFDMEEKLKAGRAPSPGFVTAEQQAYLIGQARAALAKFQDFNTSRGMVVRKPLDSPRNDSLIYDLFTFYKSYPTLFVAQQMLRRGAISSIPKMALTISATATLDFAYNLVLSLARGTLAYEDILDKINRRDKNYAEMARYVMRNPVFSNNLLGILANASIAAYTGRTQGGVLSSVGESAAVQQIKDIYVLAKQFAEPQHTWSDTVWSAYKAIGPWVLGEGYALPVRLFVAQSWGVSSLSSYGRPKSSGGAHNLSAMLDAMSTPEEQTVNALGRAMFPDYLEKLQSETEIDGVPNRFSGEYFKRARKEMFKPKVEPKPQVQPQQPTVPQVQTQPKPQVQSTTPDFSKATEPIKAPESLQ